MIHPELSTFLQSGVSVLLGTRDGDLFPDCVRGLGARVAPDGAELTVFLHATGAQTSLANLRQNHRVAVCFSRIDHVSVQLKGEVQAVGPADAADRALVAGYLRQLSESWSGIGIPPRLTQRLATEPLMAVRLRVESIFRQTPGPDAGVALVPGEARP